MPRHPDSPRGQKYPGVRYHKTNGTRIVNSPADDAALGQGWQDKPFPDEAPAPKKASGKKAAPKPAPAPPVAPAAPPAAPAAAKKSRKK